MTVTGPVALRLIAPRARPAWLALRAALVGVTPACATSTVDWYDEAQSDAAIRGCAGCPAKLQCHDFATDSRQRFGVWGGVAVARASGHRNRGPA